MDDMKQGEARPVGVDFTSNRVVITLSDGRTIGNPLSWHPWLVEATAAQRDNYELLAWSTFWPDLDEGLDIEGMLRGIKPRFS